MEYEYHWIYCSDCDMTLVFESGVERDGQGFEQIECPQCGEDLATVRVDDVCQCIGLACGYLQPGMPCCGRSY